MDLFPFEERREFQEELMKKVKNSLENKHSLIVHAPTGIGKTASVLVPALEHAMKHNLSVFFLTSKHTQHEIVLETLKKIKEKTGKQIKVTDFIAKKWMCLQKDVSELKNHDFLEYCKDLKKNDACPYYNNVKTKGKLALEDLRDKSPVGNSTIVNSSNDYDVCAYEIACEFGKESELIICDYFHLFEPSIRQSIFKKTDKDLQNSILIVDEAHNLPTRIRDMLSSRLTNYVLRNALAEAGEAEDIRTIINDLQVILEMLAGEEPKNESLIERQYFIDAIEKDVGLTLDEVISALHAFGEEVIKEKKRSFCTSVAHFLESWKTKSDDYVRIIRKSKTMFKGKEYDRLELEMYCMDPAIVSQPVINESYSTVIMSATLNPTFMYKQMLGFPPETTETAVFPSPFPVENKLSLIVPETSTKFTKRNQEQYEKIARYCSSITNKVPGNTAIFFPSYYIRDKVYEHFGLMSDKTTLHERKDMSKLEKKELFEKFKGYSQTGAVLFAVAGANFSEGVDLPGDYLKSVIIVGVPLEKPDLKTKALIDHYEKKFQAGWDYAYIVPAINRCLQAAGRCIRSETDKGVVVFMDERFAWPKYFKLLPHSWKFMITKNPSEKVTTFFKQ